MGRSSADSHWKSVASKIYCLEHRAKRISTHATQHLILPRHGAVYCKDDRQRHVPVDSGCVHRHVLPLVAATLLRHMLAIEHTLV